MFQAVADVGIGLEVEHPIAAFERPLEDAGIEHVALDQSCVRTPKQPGYKLPAAGSEIVHHDHLDALRRQAVRERAADESGAARDTNAPHVRSSRDTLRA